MAKEDGDLGIDLIIGRILCSDHQLNDKYCLVPVMYHVLMHPS